MEVGEVKELIVAFTVFIWMLCMAFAMHPANPRNVYLSWLLYSAMFICVLVILFCGTC